MTAGARELLQPMQAERGRSRRSDACCPTRSQQPVERAAAHSSAGTESSRKDVGWRVGKRRSPGMTAAEGEKGRRFGWIAMLTPAGIPARGLGKGPVIGYGCVVLMGQQAC